MNIFVCTEKPQLAGEKMKAIPAIAACLSGLKAGHRQVGKDDSLPIFPDGGKDFAVK